MPVENGHEPCVASLHVRDAMGDGGDDALVVARERLASQIRLVAEVVAHTQVGDVRASSDVAMLTALKP